ncbi:glutamate ABC transporter substrate-binding protein [Streptomyces sp. NPDC048473]|uniref:glutamate ABC transporter substrate-binding protein n=1 Tax=unclassified Streptomyces TaxID=2593676 RepID=UPI0037133848
MSDRSRPRAADTRTRVRRRNTAVALVLLATAVLTSACSGGSASTAEVPGKPGQAAGAKAALEGSAVIDRTIADYQPATDAQIPKGSTAAEIKKRGKLIVGGTRTAALFSLFDPSSEKVEGFDAALSRLLAKYIIGKPETELVNVTATTREALLKNHSVDTVFATYTITDERSKEVDFAGPYYVDGLGIQVKKTSDIAGLKDLAGKTVVTESGSTAGTVVKDMVPNAKFQLFETNTECLQALRQGRADAYVLDQGVLAGNAATNPDVKVLRSMLSNEPYGIGLPLDKPDFKRFVNDWLRQIEADGTWETVWKNTIGTQVPGQAPLPPSID